MVLCLLAGAPRAVVAAEGQQGSRGAVSAKPSGERTSSQTAVRFGSLKSDRVEARQGAGSEHPVLWVFKRAGTPVEILGETNTWRQVRDAEGATGWVQSHDVSNRRTAVILAGQAKASESAPQVALRVDDSESAAPVALVEAGVIADLRTCDGRWCYVSVGVYRGWVEQAKLWGLAAGEVIR